MNCKHIWLLAIGLAAFQTMGQNPAPASANNTNVPVMPDIHKASYAIGESMGADLKSHFAEINLDDLFTGIKETMTGKPKYSESELRIILNDFTRAYQYQRIEKHKNDEKAFLSKNGKEPGVITLSNGLQYLVISNGTGALPGTNDLVTVTFRAHAP